MWWGSNDEAMNSELRSFRIKGAKKNLIKKNLFWVHTRNYKMKQVKILSIKRLINQVTSRMANQISSDEFDCVGFRKGV